MANKILRKIRFWQDSLGLSNYRVGIELISPLQVTTEDGSVGGKLVGGVLNEEKRMITIISTKRHLKDEDVLHELLHKKYPDFSEEEVNDWTESILVTRNFNFRESRFSGRERLG